MTVFISRIAPLSFRQVTKTLASNIPDIYPASTCFIPKKNNLFRKQLFRNYSNDNIQPTTMAMDNTCLPLKKKTVYKKAVLEDLTKKDGHYLTLAYATAYSYDLKALREGLVQQKLYEPGTLKAQEIGDVVVANAVYTIGDEPREIIFFQEGAVVFWNCSELEANNVLEFIRQFEEESYPRDVVKKEREVMTYQYQNNAKRCHLQDQESSFVLVPSNDNSLERYTFSHAMAQSARLGAWEARLAALAADVRSHATVMEKEGASHVEKKEVVRKLGELFTLRHRLNVESDLLDTPDFYWEEERLERLYSSTVAYFTIPRRTRVLNERLCHCVELLELLSSWAADRHHVRLEWMVIALILAEVCFELLHCCERYLFDRLKAQEIGDVVVANAVYTIGDEPREIIFFQEGAVVFWNCSELEANNVLEFIRQFEEESYPRDVVKKEREVMTYQYQNNAKRCHLQDQESSFVLVPSNDNSLERYTFSHAMAQSARLGAWEARLAALAADVRSHATVMEKEGASHVEKKEVVRKLGELFTLRHRLNVESDLLDTPDFYWEEERLERLYSSTVAYFTIPRRTRVLNERLCHCVELLELLSSWAADRHHVRLEWMVIALILAEVCFELLQCCERYLFDR